MEHKIVKQIDCPTEWEAVDDYGSHRPLLWVMLSNNPESHPIAEFGSGFGSTPYLKEYCRQHNIKFKSWETDEVWASQTGATYIKSFKLLNLLMGYRIFIDGKPGEERQDLIYRYRDNNVLVIHDTEIGADYVYGMSEILSTFKFRLDYQPEGKPHTTAVSNTVDVTQWV